MISRIIKVEVGVISRSGRLRLITLTEKSVSGVGAGFKLCMRNSLVKAPFILRSLKWDRSEIDLRSVLRSVRDRVRTCSHWRLLIRQIIPNLGGLSSLFTLWPRVRWVAWHRPAFFFGRFLTFHGNRFFFFFPIIRVGLCLGSVYRVMGCTRAVWRARKKQL